MSLLPQSHMCHQLLCLYGLASLVSSIPSESYNLPKSPSSKISEPRGRNLMGIFHLELNVSRSLTLCGSLYLFLSTVGGSFSNGGWGRHCSMTIGECHKVILLLCSFNRTVTFGFPICPWPIYSQVLGHLSSVRHGINPMEWTLNPIR